MTNDFHPEQNGVTAVFLQAPNTFSTTHKYLIHLFSTFAGTFIYNCVGLEALDFDFTTAAEFYTEIKFYYEYTCLRQMDMYSCRRITWGSGRMTHIL